MSAYAFVTAMLGILLFTTHSNCQEETGMCDALTVVVTSKKSFSQAQNWQLSINSAGEANLIMDDHGEERNVRFELERNSWTRIRKTIIDQKFFELRAPEFGDRVLDGGSEVITVIMGTNVKTVELFSVANLQGSRLQESGEVIRVARVLIEIRNCFSVSDAIDMREHYKKFIDRSKGD